MPEPKKQPMVGWYDVGQLLDTARKTIISTVIGENADQRLTNASLTIQPVYDYSFHLQANERDFQSNGVMRQDLWIDYVADVGDGWNSTYSVAYNLAKKELQFENEPTKRGELLIFGGDEVYPTASQKEYESRLIRLYRMAFARSLDKSATKNEKIDHEKTDHDNPAAELTEAPHVFAIPGNHDWYDSLMAFRYLFAARYFNNRMFAGHWRTRQRRSYFAIKLPYDWWVFGIDLQLTHTIDWAQLEYFKNIIETNNSAKALPDPAFKKDSKVIICSPEPLWVEKEKYRAVSNETSFDEDKLNLRILEKMIRDNGSEVKLYLAGDSHHYRRFEEITSNNSKSQKITAGGGGAFLHPTHDIDFDVITEAQSNQEFHLETEYPDKTTSKKLSWKNLWFPLINRRFGLVSGALYAIIVWLVHGGLVGKLSLGTALWQTINNLVNNPLALLVIVLLLLGLIFFTDSQSNKQKYLGGLLHGFSHLAAIFFIGWGGYWLFQMIDNHHYESLSGIPSNILWFLVVIPVSFLAGWIAGSLIMGWYLFISLNFFGRHSNEAFSALKIEDFKCFLRLHLTKESLTIYPFGIDTVARDWKPQPNGNDVKYYEPVTDITPKEIEPKIEIIF